MSQISGNLVSLPATHPRVKSSPRIHTPTGRAQNVSHIQTRGRPAPEQCRKLARIVTIRKRAHKCSAHTPPGCSHRLTDCAGPSYCTSAACYEGSAPPCSVWPLRQTYAPCRVPPIGTACKAERRAAPARSAPRANSERSAPAMGKACPQPPAACARNCI
eukprot:6211169-Pleurochrysis_carterae.AAC.2